MRAFFSIIFWVLLTGSSQVLAQDTTLYKNTLTYQDGCNNRIVPRWVGCGHPEYELFLCNEYTSVATQIYDRWGNLLFEQTGKLLQWDHKDKNGNRIDEGTYIFRITSVDSVGVRQTHTGSFNFIP